MAIKTDTYVYATSLDQLQETGVMTLQLDGNTVAIFAQGDGALAVDNRCPHMGFPLNKGTTKDGILTCHWHHARFDLESGGTFDQWADDVRAFPVQIRDGDIYVDVAAHRDARTHQRERLAVGLGRDLSLVMGKSVLVLTDNGGDTVEPFRIGLEFGTTYRWQGWGMGLTIHGCMTNLLPKLMVEDRPRALYHGLSAVASEAAGSAPRFAIRPLPSIDTDILTLKRWFRQFIEVRDAEGAERCIASAVRAGGTDRDLADMLFAAVTDHRYIDNGHTADFTNKAFEALDIVGWESAETVLTSLAVGYAMADRKEESNAWRNPIDLIAILDDAFDRLPTMVVRGKGKTWSWEDDEDTFVANLLGDDPQAIVEALLDALENGCAFTELASAVTYAAALRIARFHTSNEFGDWITAMHTFSFANGIELALHRAPSIETLRGVFDAAMGVYLDRFLNIPAARIPQPDVTDQLPEELLAKLRLLLDKQQRVNESADVVAEYMRNGYDPDALIATMGMLLLREDRDFHTIQCVEGALRQYDKFAGTEKGTHVLIAAIRYLAAHSPTVRAQGQTYQIASRLHHGEKLFEGD
jgi:nitrite reductase/ring-hydroxylating ferredoxin subunit